MASKCWMMLIAAVVLAPLSAMAEVHAPEAFERLTAVPMAPGQAPRLVNGMSDLSTMEGRHNERLPVQLEAAIAKMKRAKYNPRLEKLPVREKKFNMREKLPMKHTARENPTDF